MRLYLIQHCPFAHRAAMALREKGVEFELRFFESGRRPPELEAVGPRAKSPTLFDGDARIHDSQVVLEYIEERFADPPLLPKDPVQRAGVRMLIARYGDELGPKEAAVISEFLVEREPDRQKVAAAKRAFTDALRPWDAYLKGRTFAVGETLTLADITMYTFFPSLAAVASLEIPPELGSLRAWHDRIRARPTAEVPAPG